MTPRILISGCSGGGKSTLLEELRRRGERVVAEPGRRIVAEELRGDGQALPWIDGVAFARRAIAMALADLAALDPAGPRLFFDRGLIDAAVGLEHLTGEPATGVLALARRFHHQVMLAPPWPEMYREDAERRHGFDDAVAEFDRLASAYRRLDYTIVLLPKIAVAARADFVLGVLAGD